MEQRNDEGMLRRKWGGAKWGAHAGLGLRPPPCTQVVLAPLGTPADTWGQVSAGGKWAWSKMGKMAEIGKMAEMAEMGRYQTPPLRGAYHTPAWRLKWVTK